MTPRLPLAAAAALLIVGGDAARAEPDLAAGEARYAQTCANCHGRAGKGMASFPKISGRDAAYLADRLRRYRDGERIGPNALLMIPMAADLTDAEIENLAAFVSMTFQ